MNHNKIKAIHFLFIKADDQEHNVLIENLTIPLNARIDIGE